MKKSKEKLGELWNQSLEELTKKIIYHATIDGLENGENNAHAHIRRVACLTGRQLQLRLEKPEMWSYTEIKRMTKKFGHEFSDYIKSQF